MIILVMLQVLGLIGCIMVIKYRGNILKFIGILCIVLGLGLTVIVIPAFIINYYKCLNEIEAFKETRLVYERASANGDNIVEAFQAIESNRWLRKQQYWNETIFDIAIPDKIMKLEVIK